MDRHAVAPRLLAVLSAAAIALTTAIALPTASEAAPKPGSSRVAAAAPELKKGDKGEPVKVLQRALKIKPVSGYFGPVTQIAVIRFQSDNGIDPTGVVGADTWAALGDDVARAAAESDGTFGDKQVDGRYCPAVDFTYGDGFGAGRNHMGLDLMGKMGSPIYAIDAGKVSRSGYQSNGALVLDIDSKDGHMWFYGHFSKIVVGEGDTVKAGQLIGYMGDTGAPGAVHLHVELRPSGWTGPAQDDEELIRQLCA